MVEESIGLVTALNPYIGYENASMIAQEAPSHWREHLRIDPQEGSQLMKIPLTSLIDHNRSNASPRATT
jgi:aspartate ammonia-lyase